MSIIFAFLILTLFGASETVNFECSYEYHRYAVVGKIYYCNVKHEVTVNSRDEAVSISGSHQSGHNNDIVKGISVYSNIYFFPRRLENYFKNIQFISMGKYLKEIRQVDLKPFTMLRVIYLLGTIEILEHGLFDNNLELEFIYLGSNKIVHIDSNVFNNLSKLSTLYLHGNTCINMRAEKSKTEVQKVIQTAKAQCTKPDYSNIEQKFKNLKLEADSLSAANLAEKIKNLENEAKNSNFSNYFEEEVKTLKNIQAKKVLTETTTTMPTTTLPTTTTQTQSTTTESPKSPEICTEIAKIETCSALNSKFVSLVTNLKDLVIQAANKSITNVQSNFTGELPAQFEQCSVSDGQLANLTESFGNFKDDYSKQAKATDEMAKMVTIMGTKIDESESNLNTAVTSMNESFNERLEDMELTLTNLQTFTFRGIDRIELEVKKVHAGVISTTMRKFDSIMKNVEDINSKFEKIMKALNITG